MAPEQQSRNRADVLLTNQRKHPRQVILTSSHEEKPRRGHDVGVDGSEGGHRHKDRHQVKEDEGNLGAVGDRHGTGCHDLSGREDDDVGQVGEEVEHGDDNHGDADGHRNGLGQRLLHFFNDLTEC